MSGAAAQQQGEVGPVLLAEDDPDVSEAIAAVLEDQGYEVLIARDGAQALEALAVSGRAPAVILLDLMMPVMDGWAFRAEQLRDARFASIPVVVLSAHADVRQAAVDLSAAAWLKKPVELGALLRAVRSAKA